MDRWEVFNHEEKYRLEEAITRRVNFIISKCLAGETKILAALGYISELAMLYGFLEEMDIIYSDNDHIYNFFHEFLGDLESIKLNKRMGFFKLQGIESRWDVFSEKELQLLQIVIYSMVEFIAMQSAVGNIGVLSELGYLSRLTMLYQFMEEIGIPRDPELSRLLSYIWSQRPGYLKDKKEVDNKLQEQGITKPVGKCWVCGVGNQLPSRWANNKQNLCDECAKPIIAKLKGTAELYTGIRR